MPTISVDFSISQGPVKPMHAVNNGPIYQFDKSQRVTNLRAWQEAGIPYARTHDSSIHYTYGGEHVVDVHAIFKDFEKDPLDPASYDFRITDEFLKVIQTGGSKVFYRLGSKIEHWPKKYGTLPPKDFKKWALICEHIIRHYTQGWADGFKYDIVYWEIWNEPDLDPDDSTHKRCWGGSKQEFFDFYNVASKHLKACFPHLKIGGPSLAGGLEWARDFLEQVEVVPDFFSWHIYSTDPYKITEKARDVRLMLDDLGFHQTESILNEWNYVINFEGPEWITSSKVMKSLKGAAFLTATMCACQNEPVDMLMYYDARPCFMNGLFDTDYVNECLKGYYTLKMFNSLYELGQSVQASSDDKRLFAAAAASLGKGALMLAGFSEEDPFAGPLKLNFKNFAAACGAPHGVKLRFFLLDEEHNLETIREEVFFSDSFTSIISLEAYASLLVLLEALPPETLS
ncbi:MAG: hypothetical protein GX345_04525 [Clostridiales bacterium]|nr:hypothetical protein [Clostridiales bacterium]